MSGTSSVLSLVRQLTEKVKQKQNTEKSNSSANAALIKKLSQMESAYNESRAQEMPDYSQQLAAAPQLKPVVLKSQQQLMSEASEQIRQQAAQFQKTAGDKAATQVENLENQQMKAADTQQAQLNKAYADFDSNRQQISQSTIRQGLTHSTIKDAWQQENTQQYLSGHSAILQQYDAKIAEIQRQIDTVNAAKLQSLADYNLKQAAEYEKTLSKLTADHLKEIETINAYNKKALLQQQQREQQIAELQAQWRKDERQNQLQNEEIEREIGYSGEKQLEMQNRYNTALEFYNRYDKNEALRLIEENKEDLRKILGLYYDRLIGETSSR